MGAALGLLGSPLIPQLGSFGPVGPNNPVVAIVGGWEAGTLLSGAPHMNSAIWSNPTTSSDSRCVRVVASGVSPTGASDATSLTAAAEQYGGLYRNAVASSAGEQYLKCYAKAVTHQYVGLRVGQLLTSGDIYTTFNLNDGSVTNIAAGTTATAKPIGGGWWEIATTGYPGTDGLRDLSIVPSNGSHSWTPTGTENVLVWGMAYGDGNGAGRYIPTGADPVTETDYEYNQSTGVITLARALSADATGLTANGIACVGSGTVWRVPPVWV